MKELPDRVWLLRWQVHNSMGEDTHRGQFITKSTERAMAKKKQKVKDKNCFNVELYTTTVAWRLVD